MTCLILIIILKLGHLGFKQGKRTNTRGGTPPWFASLASFGRIVQFLVLFLGFFFLIHRVTKRGGQVGQNVLDGQGGMMTVATPGEVERARRKDRKGHALFGPWQHETNGQTHKLFGRVTDLEPLFQQSRVQLFQVDQVAHFGGVQFVVDLHFPHLESRPGDPVGQIRHDGRNAQVGGLGGPSSRTDKGAPNLAKELDRQTNGIGDAAGDRRSVARLVDLAKEFQSNQTTWYRLDVGFEHPASSGVL